MASPQDLTQVPLTRCQALRNSSFPHQPLLGTHFGLPCLPQTDLFQGFLFPCSLLQPKLLFFHGPNTMGLSWKEVSPPLLASSPPKPLISHHLPVNLSRYLRLMTEARPLLVPIILLQSHDCSLLVIKILGIWLMFLQSH